MGVSALNPLQPNVWQLSRTKSDFVSRATKPCCSQRSFSKGCWSYLNKLGSFYLFMCSRTHSFRSRTVEKTSPHQLPCLGILRVHFEGIDQAIWPFREQASWIYLIFTCCFVISPKDICVKGFFSEILPCLYFLAISMENVGVALVLPTMYILPTFRWCARSLGSDHGMTLPRFPNIPVWVQDTIVHSENAQWLNVECERSSNQRIEILVATPSHNLSITIDCKFGGKDWKLVNIDQYVFTFLPPKQQLFSMC